LAHEPADAHPGCPWIDLPAHHRPPLVRRDPGPRWPAKSVPNWPIPVVPRTTRNRYLTYIRASIWRFCQRGAAAEPGKRYPTRDLVTGLALVDLKPPGTGRWGMCVEMTHPPSDTAEVTVGAGGSDQGVFGRRCRRPRHTSRITRGGIGEAVGPGLVVADGGLASAGVWGSRGIGCDDAWLPWC